MYREPFHLNTLFLISLRGSFQVTTHIENLMCIPEQRKLYHEGTIKVRCSNGASAYIEINKNKVCDLHVISRVGRYS